MVNVNQMRCACTSCLCVVSVADAVEKSGNYFCSDSCATGGGSHNCGHQGCPC